MEDPLVSLFLIRYLQMVVETMTLAPSYLKVVALSPRGVLGKFSIQECIPLRSTLGTPYKRSRMCPNSCRPRAIPRKERVQTSQLRITQGKKSTRELSRVQVSPRDLAMTSQTSHRDPSPQMHTLNAKTVTVSPFNQWIKVHLLSIVLK